MNVIGWLHILMGFWLVIPAILGIISLSKRNKHILRILIIELALLAIVAVIAAGYFYNEAEYYRGRYLWGDCSSCRYYSQDNFSYFASACLAFVISILPLPYLSRKDVHQAFP